MYNVCDVNEDLFSLWRCVYRLSTNSIKTYNFMTLTIKFNYLIKTSAHIEGLCITVLKLTQTVDIYQVSLSYEYDSIQ